MGTAAEESPTEGPAAIGAFASKSVVSPVHGKSSFGALRFRLLRDMAVAFAAKDWEVDEEGPVTVKHRRSREGWDQYMAALEVEVPASFAAERLWDIKCATAARGGGGWSEGR